MLDLTLSEELNGRQTEDLNFDLIQSYINYFKPTEKDLNYQPNTEELKQLCLRTKCYVLISRWNPLHDYFELFKREGRVGKKSIKYIHKLLVKAVHRHSSAAIYKDEEISEIRQREWGLRKKENLLLLNLWQYDSKSAVEDNNNETELDNIVLAPVAEREQAMQTTKRIPIATTEILIAAKKTPQKTPSKSARSSRGNFNPTHIVGCENEEDGVYDGDVEGNDSYSQDSVELVPTISSSIGKPASKNVDRRDSLEMVLMHTYVDSTNNSTLVSNTIDLVANENDLEKELMPPADLDNRIVNGFLNLNTESMPLTSESIASFDSVVPLYENLLEFPLTSTQSQSQSHSQLPSGNQEPQ